LCHDRSCRNVLRWRYTQRLFFEDPAKIGACSNRLPSLVVQSRSTIFEAFFADLRRRSPATAVLAMNSTPLPPKVCCPAIAHLQVIFAKCRDGGSNFLAESCCSSTNYANFLPDAQSRERSDIAETSLVTSGAYSHLACGESFHSMMNNNFHHTGYCTNRASENSKHFIDPSI